MWCEIGCCSCKQYHFCVGVEYTDPFDVGSNWNGKDFDHGWKFAYFEWGIEVSERCGERTALVLGSWWGWILCRIWGSVVMRI